MFPTWGMASEPSVPLHWSGEGVGGGGGDPEACPYKFLNLSDRKMLRLDNFLFFCFLFCPAGLLGRSVPRNANSRASHSGD